MAPQIRWFSWVVVLAGVGTLTGGLRQTCAQTLNEGWNVLEKKFNDGGRSLALGFLKGASVDPNNKNHIEAIDLLAKTFTYAVYLQKLETKPEGIRKDYAGYERALDTDIQKAKNPQAMQTFVDIFRDKVRVHALEVIQYKDARPIHKIHNARILAKTAELGQPELADTFIALLKDPQQNDAVHFYMLQGLATLIPRLQPQAPQQAKCAGALVEFLEQKKGPDKKATAEEIDGFRYLRREAVRALAKIHTPALNDKVRPALVLARFAGNDASIQPPPRIDERMEAAIGLAHMQAPPKDKQYQVDYAAGQIARCLGALAQVAENERANKEARTHPWPIYATHLHQSLELLKKNNDKNAYVAQVAGKGTQILKKIINGSQIDASEQNWWNSPQSEPPSKELFQGSADSVVKPGEAVLDK